MPEKRKVLDWTGLSKYTERLKSKLNGFVPTSRTINGQALSKDITLTASNISGIPSTSDFVPKSRRVNGLPLSSDINLNAVSIGIVNSSSSSIPTGAYAISIGDDNANGLIESIAIGRHINIQTPTSGVIDYRDACIAIGSNITILDNATGSICIGQGSKSSMSDSVAIGPQAYSHGRGVAIGKNANVTSGDVAIGNSSYATGSSIAVGENSNASTFSTSVGHNTISRASGSVAIGSNASVQSSGSGSISIGLNASCMLRNCISLGKYSTTAANNSIAIGQNSSATGVEATAIGPKAYVTEDSTMRLGSDKLSALTCVVQLTTTSDERDKIAISPIEDGAVEFLKLIKTIRYFRNLRTFYIQEEQYDEEGNVVEGTEMSKEDKDNFASYGLCSYDKEAHARGDKKGKRVRVGVLAQNVLQALKTVYGDESYGNLVDDNFYDKDRSTIPEGVENQLSVSYSNFIPFLIKAIQEQQGQLEILQNENKEFRSRIERLEAKS